jgi:hypothetical protein
MPNAVMLNLIQYHVRARSYIEVENSIRLSVGYGIPLWLLILNRVQNDVARLNERAACTLDRKRRLRCCKSGDWNSER